MQLGANTPTWAPAMWSNSFMPVQAAQAPVGGASASKPGPIQHASGRLALSQLHAQPGQTRVQGQRLRLIWTC